MSTKNSELHNFADDNIITSFSGMLSQLIKDLQSEANKAIDWLKGIIRRNIKHFLKKSI